MFCVMDSGRDSGRQRSAPTIAALRLTCVALLIGPVMFAAVIAFMHYGTGAEPDGASELRFLGIVAGASIAVLAPIAFVIRSQIWQRVSGAGGEAAQRTTYASGVLVFMSLLEMCVLLNLVAWLVTAEFIPAVPVAVVALALSAASLPSDEQFENMRR